MSSNYLVLGLAMAAAGVLTDVLGARTIWIAAGIVYLFAALVALAMTQWLPVTAAGEHDAIEASSESAVAGLGNGRAAPAQPGVAANGARERPLERIATLLEEIEARREVEARRSG
jgi:MFS family permease